MEAAKDQVGDDHSQTPKEIRREIDSLDDFEHLGHDASPTKKTGGHNVITGDLLTDFSGDIAKEIDNNATPSNNLMDTNLVDLGGSFPDRKQADEKLDKFLQDIQYSTPKHQDFDVIKSATMDLLGAERGNEFTAAPQSEFSPKNEFAAPKNDSNEFLDRYSDDSGAEEDLSYKKAAPSQSKTFQDVKDDFLGPKDEPVLPPRDYPTPEVKTEVPAPVLPKVVPPEVIKPVKSVQKVITKPKETVIEAEAIFRKIGLDAWFNPERLNPNVESLIYWRDPKKSGPVFGGVFVILLALTYFSLISVVAYLSLVALSGTVAFRIYKNVVQAVQKTGEGHPFKEYLEIDISLSPEKIKEVSEIVVAHVNAAASELRRLFLVEDLVDSIKFGVLLWTLTYLGAWFNGMTLIILAWVALFSLPKVYETNKTQIDANLEIVKSKLSEITSKVRAAVPIGKKEEKKDQ